jgi:CspA family cold shock protein
MAKELINSKGEVFYQASGIVKSYNEQTGYGFIFSIEEPDRDIYFHYSQLLVEGKKVVAVGDTVEFLYKEHEGKGLRAFSIKKVS